MALDWHRYHLCGGFLSLWERTLLQLSFQVEHQVENRFGAIKVIIIEVV